MAIAPAKAKKVRAFLKKQHADLIAVKQKHIAKGLEPVQAHKSHLADKLNEWTDGDSFDPAKAKSAKRWALATAAALGNNMRRSLESSARDASDLASDHAEQFSGFAADVFGDESVDIFGDDEAYEDDEGRLNKLQASYVGNSRRGIFAAFSEVAKAVSSAMMLSDFSKQIDADSEDASDIAEGVFSPVESRTEMYIRTETGRVYGQELAGVAGEDEKLQKRWATIDPGCEEVCHPADGQIQDMDDDFEMGDGSTCDFPPAHPRCDCTWLPWKESYDNPPSTDNVAAPESEAA